MATVEAPGLLSIGSRSPAGFAFFGERDTKTSDNVAFLKERIFDPPWQKIGMGLSVQKAKPKYGKHVSQRHSWETPSPMDLGEVTPCGWLCWDSLGGGWLVRYVVAAL